MPAKMLTQFLAKVKRKIGDLQVGENAVVSAHEISLKDDGTVWINKEAEFVDLDQETSSRTSFITVTRDESGLHIDMSHVLSGLTYHVNRLLNNRHAGEVYFPVESIFTKT